MLRGHNELCAEQNQSAVVLLVCQQPYIAYCNKCGIWAYLLFLMAYCKEWTRGLPVHEGNYVFSVIMEQMWSAGIFELFLVHMQNLKSMILHFRVSCLIPHAF
jgi:hypothetical protein